MPSPFRSLLLVLALSALASPARAQWTQVEDVPATPVYSVWANGDTIIAGQDSTAYLSTDGGTTWKLTAKVVAVPQAITTVMVRNGRLYAGTYGKGVFTSDDLGDTWQAYNQGLVGGFVDSQLFLMDLVVRGDSLYAATSGAGVYVRNLAGPGTWSHFGEEFEANQASGVDGLALGGTRLLAVAGGNGSVFFRDPGAPDWTISWLDNVGLHPGLQAQSAAWNGNGWVVGTLAGVFHSVLGQEPWGLTTLGLGFIQASAFATHGQRFFAAFDVLTAVVIENSDDDGATWHVLEALRAKFVYKLAMHGSDLYAGRADGLFRRSTADVAGVGPGTSAGLRFALAGPQPVANEARFRFDLPEAGSAAIEIFDVAGRRALGTIRGSWPAGANEVSLDAHALAPGVYAARLTASGRQDAVRFAHVH